MSKDWTSHVQIRVSRVPRLARLTSLTSFTSHTPHVTRLTSPNSHLPSSSLSRVSSHFCFSSCLVDAGFRNKTTSPFHIE